MVCKSECNRHSERVAVKDCHILSVNQVCYTSAFKTIPSKGPVFFVCSFTFLISLLIYHRWIIFSEVILYKNNQKETYKL